MPIVKNEDARQNLINGEVDRAVKLCQAAADKGLNSIQFTMSKDIQRDVRNVLEDEHDVVVPMMVYCGLNSPKSHRQIDHYGGESHMKLKW